MEKASKSSEFNKESAEKEAKDVAKLLKDLQQYIQDSRTVDTASVEKKTGEILKWLALTNQHINILQKPPYSLSRKKAKYQRLRKETGAIQARSQAAPGGKQQALAKVNRPKINNSIKMTNDAVDELRQLKDEESELQQSIDHLEALAQNLKTKRMGLVLKINELKEEVAELEGSFAASTTKTVKKVANSGDMRNTYNGILVQEARNNESEASRLNAELERLGTLLRKTTIEVQKKSRHLKEVQCSSRKASMS